MSPRHPAALRCWAGRWVMLTPSVVLFFVSGISHAKMVWTDGIIGGLFTYILFWTLVYAVVHIY